MSNATNISKLKDILVYMVFTIGLILIFFSEFGSDFKQAGVLFWTSNHTKTH